MKPLLQIYLRTAGVALARQHFLTPYLVYVRHLEESTSTCLSRRDWYQVLTVDRQLLVSIDSYKCRSTVISIGRQFFFSTLVSVDVQLLTVNGQLLTV